MPELDAITSYNRLALRARRRGSADEALLYLANALRLARECGRPLLEAHARHAMGQVYAQAGRPELAACCCRTALRLLDRAGAKPATVRLERSINANLAAFEQA